MRFNILQLLKNLRFHSHGKEIIDADILEWANSKVRSLGGQSHMDSFKVLFLELLFYLYLSIYPSIHICISFTLEVQSWLFGFQIQGLLCGKDSKSDAFCVLLFVRRRPIDSFTYIALLS